MAAIATMAAMPAKADTATMDISTLAVMAVKTCCSCYCYLLQYITFRLSALCVISNSYIASNIYDCRLKIYSVISLISSKFDAFLEFGRKVTFNLLYKL